MRTTLPAAEHTVLLAAVAVVDTTLAVATADGATVVVALPLPLQPAALATALRVTLKPADGQAVMPVARLQVAVTDPGATATPHNRRHRQRRAIANRREHQHRRDHKH